MYYHLPPSRGFLHILLILIIALSTGTLPAVFAAPKVTLAENSLSRYVVKLQKAGDVNELRLYALNIKQLFTQAQSSQFSNVYSFNSKQSLSQLKQGLAGHFIYLENDGDLAEAAVLPNDYFFTNNPQDVNKQWGLAKADFPDAWGITVGSKKNIVAVIDTGIDAIHEDLRSTGFVYGFDFINNAVILTYSNSDDNGHGTLVAGILGATTNNGIGMAGTNWNITLMPIKALDASGKGESSIVAEAIVWAADHGAGFINLSFGGIGFGHDTTLANAITYAFNKNVVIVAAAGNDLAVTGGSLDNNPVFPICDDNGANMIIGVAATDWNDTKPDFSNYGKSCVDVSAPGRRILSTINFDPATHASAPNSYVYAAGTSMAVPFVVGEAALIKSQFPQATNIQIRDRIISSADNIDALNPTQCGGSSCAGLLGAGRINVFKALTGSIEPAVADGDLVETSNSPAIYLISGGQKHLVSQFVLGQRFPSQAIKLVTESELATFPAGSDAIPLDGTLVKSDSSPTVFEITNGQKSPALYSVFKMRRFSFSDAIILSPSAVDSWLTGIFLPPPEGSLVKGSRSQAIYWVVGGQLHWVNFAFYKDRGLNAFQVSVLADSDISALQKGDSYTR